jgi:hypothetical protein
LTTVLTAALLCFASPLKLLGTDGSQHDPFAGAAHEPSVFLFIAHDCPVCNIYVPEIKRLCSEFGSKCQFTLIYSETGVTSVIARKHAKSFGLVGTRQLLDPGGRFATECGAAITPEAAVFDASRHLVYLGRIDNLFYGIGRQRPAATVHDLNRALTALLANKPVPAASGKPVGCYIETSLP